MQISANSWLTLKGLRYFSYLGEKEIIQKQSEMLKEVENTIKLQGGFLP